MAISLSAEESVQRDGESWGIGDKVYGKARAPFGVGYIQAIELYGVHFGFRAKISSTMLDEPVWVDSRNLMAEQPEWSKSLSV